MMLRSWFYLPFPLRCSKIDVYTMYAVIEQLMHTTAWAALCLHHIGNALGSLAIVGRLKKPVTAEGTYRTKVAANNGYDLKASNSLLTNSLCLALEDQCPF
eukprot:scaffold618836_cov18-Prasinocladus_malaysianus.AAC.1